MTTLDDKILGIKKDYYCSSSESEEEENESESGSDVEKTAEDRIPTEQYKEPASKWEGSSKNTGPKGVIRDWKLYKQLETEKRLDLDLQKIQLAKKLTLSNSQKPDDEEDKDLLELMNDDFLLQFQKQRMEEMLSKPTNQPSFGSVISLQNGNEFLDAIDNENKSVTIIIHIYEERNSGCKAMNKCIVSLSKQYPSVKFCKINVCCAGMSLRFKMDGVPALLVYKEGSVIGNFVRVTDELGDEFYDSDVENFLIEHGILNDPYCVPMIMQHDDDDDDDDDDDSDWSLE
ncbi:phosducin-like protein [Halyomorpha halys]|uniref:phosducin-like protein n=1 Tax=Halyomorpha halys TaxID=286706 RepID=UPI0006D4C76E|nr:phosducin-like protein [Halyomorpha halys]